MVLYVTDGTYSGTADVDGDGKAEIIWQGTPAPDKHGRPARFILPPPARKPVTQ
jgi:hypothetical protein